jgi:hypothetical protein
MVVMECVSAVPLISLVTILYVTVFMLFEIHPTSFFSCVHLISFVFFLQRVNSCLQQFCAQENSAGLANGTIFCKNDYLDCGGGESNVRIVFANDTNFAAWKNISFGIYTFAVPVILEVHTIDKYVYSVFWGFQVSLVNLFVFR